MTDDKWDRNQQADGFNTEASQTKPPKSAPDLPPAEDLLKAGITTESTLNREKAQKIEPKAPSPTPNDPDGWATAQKEAQRAHDNAIEQRRAEFRNLAEQMRTKFNKRGLDRE